MEQLCRTCVYRNDWSDPDKCYADLEYHDPDDTCPFWTGTLRNEPLNDPSMRKED